MATKIDARGRSCPEPVLMTKKAFETINATKFEIIVDTEVAKDNITRFVKNKGYDIICEEQEQNIILYITKK